MNMYHGVMGKKVTGVEPKGTHLVLVLEDESRLIIEPGATFSIEADGHVRLNLYQHVRLEKPGEVLTEDKEKRKDEAESVVIVPEGKLSALNPDGFVED